jgi:hypothetical protein
MLQGYRCHALAYGGYQVHQHLNTEVHVHHEENLRAFHVKRVNRVSRVSRGSRVSRISKMGMFRRIGGLAGLAGLG